MKSVKSTSMSTKLSDINKMEQEMFEKLNQTAENNKKESSQVESLENTPTSIPVKESSELSFNDVFTLEKIILFSLFIVMSLPEFDNFIYKLINQSGTIYSSIIKATITITILIILEYLFSLKKKL